MKPTGAVLIGCLTSALTLPSLPALAETSKGGLIGGASVAAYDECKEAMPPAMGKVPETKEDGMRSYLFGNAGYTPDYPDTAPLYETCRLSMEAAGNPYLLVSHLCVADKINAR